MSDLSISGYGDDLNINSDYLGNVDELATDVVDLISSRTKEPKKYSDSYYK